MARYQYRCDCGREFEVERSIHNSEDQVPACPGCGEKHRARQLFSPPAVVFKGGGWTPRHYDKPSKEKHDGQSNP
jgi:putative FmdB family regulatory protein